jgi:thiosulfate dehydrogenase
MGSFLLGVVTGLVLFPVMAGAWMSQGLMPASATAQPPAWEAKLAQRWLTASVARSAPRASNPIAATDANLLEGMKLYKNGCDGCHGQATQTSSWGTTCFYPRVPQFAQAHPLLSEAELFWVVKNGIRYSGMAGWNGQYSDEEIWKVVTFLSHLDRLPPQVVEEWRRKQ